MLCISHPLKTTASTCTVVVLYTIKPKKTLECVSFINMKAHSHEYYKNNFKHETEIHVLQNKINHVHVHVIRNTKTHCT